MCPLGLRTLSRSYENIQQSRDLVMTEIKMITFIKNLHSFSEDSSCITPPQHNSNGIFFFWDCIATSCNISDHLTGRKDELVAGQVRLINEDIRLLHLELLGHLTESQEMIVYRHPCDGLANKEQLIHMMTIPVEQRIQMWQQKCWLCETISAPWTTYQIEHDLNAATLTAIV